jgi:Protein of unknown function (DUF3025)
MHSVLDSLASTLQRPPAWLTPYLPVLGRILQSGATETVAEALNAANIANAATVQFVEHSALPARESYEAFIARTGRVPTRDNLHDLFNGVVWLGYPLTKQRMNRLQAQEIASRGDSGPRGPIRDALTLFDENGAVLQAPQELIGMLRNRDWQKLFFDQRSLWESARLVLLGHALIEKLMQPRKPMTAHVWVVDELSDEALAASLTTERLAAKIFLPLPVLGVPGWWPANEEPGFYDDPTVFRPTRST